MYLVFHFARTRLRQLLFVETEQTIKLLLENESSYATIALEYIKSRHTVASLCISSMDWQTRQRHATFPCSATAISVFTFDRNYERKTSSLCKHHRSVHNEELATDSNFISFSGHKKLFKCHDTHHYDFHYQPVSSGSDGASKIKRRRRWRKVWINYHNRNNRIIALTTGGREGGRGVIRNSVNDPDKKFQPKARE